MKHLKYSFKNFTINRFCKRNNIFNYKINEDGSIDVKGDVNLYKKEFIKIPIKFNRVDGAFIINKDSNITTLENCPVYAGSFNCGYCNIITLLNGPRYVKNNYECSYCKLQDVYGFPENFQGKLEIGTGSIGHFNEGTRKNPIFIVRNPVLEIVNIRTETKNNQVKFINYINEEKVIRNGNIIIQDRLEEALFSFGLNGNAIQFTLCDTEFKYYKLI